MQTSNGVTCLFAAMDKYLQIHTVKADPVFIDSLSIYYNLMQCFDIMGVDSSNYYFYPFRIGAAAIPVLQGVDSKAIQGSGWWFSNAFRTIIHSVISFYFMQPIMNKRPSRSKQSLDYGIFFHQKSSHLCRCNEE